MLLNRSDIEEHTQQPQQINVPKRWWVFSSTKTLYSSVETNECQNPPAHRSDWLVVCDWCDKAKLCAAHKEIGCVGEWVRLTVVRMWLALGFETKYKSLWCLVRSFGLDHCAVCGFALSSIDITFRCDDPTASTSLLVEAIRLARHSRARRRLRVWSPWHCRRRLSSQCVSYSGDWVCLWFMCV